MPTPNAQQRMSPSRALIKREPTCHLAQQFVVVVVVILVIGQIELNWSQSELSFLVPSFDLQRILSYVCTSLIEHDLRWMWRWRKTELWQPLGSGYHLSFSALRLYGVWWLATQSTDSVAKEWITLFRSALHLIHTDSSSVYHSMTWKIHNCVGTEIVLIRLASQFTWEHSLSLSLYVAI